MSDTPLSDPENFNRQNSDHQNSDHKNSPAYRAARLAVIILSSLIVLAVIALVAGGVMKLGHNASPAVAPGPMTEVALPPDARIVSLDVREGRLVLRARTAAGEEVDIIDTRTGALVSRIRSAPSGK